MKNIPYLRPFLALLAATALFVVLVPAGRVFAQAQTDQKIRLMSAALGARDAGDFTAARAAREIGRAHV